MDGEEGNADNAGNVGNSLLDGSDPTLADGEYFLSEGIKGSGERPEWYNGEKYKSVADQAKGYSELEKRFGGFKGTPKDGYALPEGIEKDDALYVELEAFANQNQMSQDAFGEAWTLLSTQGEVAEEYNQEAEIAELGDNAAERIKNVEGFMKNNLDAESYEKAKDLVTNAKTIQLVEMLIGATAQHKPPSEGGLNPEGLTLSIIETEMYKKDEQGNMLRSTSPEHEKKVQRMLEQWGGTN